jgi:hypothetical protein
MDPFVADLITFFSRLGKALSNPPSLGIRSGRLPYLIRGINS